MGVRDRGSTGDRWGAWWRGRWLGTGESVASGMGAQRDGDRGV